MNSRKVFVFQDLNYASSKTSATANTALTPDLLADGSVAVYGIQELGSTNVNKLVLITDGGGESAGKCQAASFGGKEVFIAMGTARNVEISNPIQLTAGLERAIGTKYVAPVRGIINFGYNSTTVGASFNLPTTINRGDDFQIQLFNRNYFVSGGREPGQKVILSAQAAQGDTQYGIISKWVAATNLRLDDILIDKLTIKVTTSATGSAIGNSATASVTNGSTAVTTSAAHLVTIGQYITILGDTYKAAAASGTSITLDRPYQGATNAAVANANVINTASTSEPTLLGLQMADAKDGYNIDGALKGIAINGTILRSTLPSPGEGSYLGILAYEKEALPKKGTEALIDATIPHDIYRAVSTLTYDVYILTTRNSSQPTGQQSAVFRVIMYVTLAFVSGVADSGGKNQGDWENVMTSLFGATFPQISA